MFPYSTSKALLLFLFPLILLGQVQKKDLVRLPYGELYNLYFDNDKDQAKQIECANAYLKKATTANISVEKARGYYLYALLYYNTDETKAIMYLDSVIKYSLNTNDKYFPAAGYCEKAELLKRQYKFKEAITNFNLAEKIALKTNIDFYYSVRAYIAITKSEELGQYKQALAINKECYRYYRTKDVSDPQYSSYYQNVIFGIADCYKSLKKTDSTSFYNQLGYKEATKTKNEEYKYLFVLNEGANQVSKKRYKAAIDSIKKALPQMIAFKNTGNTLAAYYYLGKAYDGLKNKEQAVKNFIKVDSIYKITKDYSTEFTSGYLYIINYYKNEGDKENQLKYLIEYMAIVHTLQSNYKELNKLVQDEYDTPHLFSEKESLIRSLNKDKIKSFWGLGGLILLSISVSGFGFYQYNLKRTYKFRFEKIVNRENKPYSVPADSNPQPNEIHTKKNKENTGIAEELVVQILEKLNQFEIHKEYLHSTISLQLLAEKLETNSKYVSKIVNIYKEKTFIKYINDLRIEHALIQLQQDRKLRNYTIQALALEFGFTSAESFSSAFFKNTGIKPSYYVEQLKNTITNT
jgi:AraC-like DNA-binding protein